MNEKTLEYAREQLKQLRQPVLTGREHDEVDIEKKMDDGLDDAIEFVKAWMKRENKRMRVYISGAITGTDDFVERFREAEDRLSNEGISVINPAHAISYMPEDTAYEEYMKLSICLLDMCEGIYMMNGWRKSCGANREYGYALASHKMVIFENGDGKELWKD